MTFQSHTKLWFPRQEELQELTPIKVRDLIIQCFFHAQKENIAHTKIKLGSQADDKSILESATTLVKMYFEDMHESFQYPTKTSLQLVAEKLEKKSMSLKTHPHILEHHRKTILSLLNKL